MKNATKPSGNGTSLVSVKDVMVAKNVRTPRADGLGDLVASIKANGILQPLLVRPKGKQYELVCGHRRFAAAKEAGLDQVPVFTRELSDVDALAAQIVENLQREDSHALDEADSYRDLMTSAKLDVASIAARVGRSVPYVYDRLRLNDLTPEIKKLFRSGEITPGHAVVLARLKPADQKRAIDEFKGGLFETEELLWSPTEENRPNVNGERGLKTRTVRELQAWVDEHVKFNAGAEDLPDLFPDTARELAAARDAALKIVPITFDHFVHPDARDGDRVLGPMSWERADGKSKSKTCENSVLGVVVVGPGRGETMRVCILKTCDVHFKEYRRRAKERAVRSGKGGAKADAVRAQKAEQARRAAEARREAEHKRFVKAVPEIAKAIAAVMPKQSVKADGRLVKMLVKEAVDWRTKKFAGALKVGKKPEDILRFLGFMLIVWDLDDYDAHEVFPKLAKQFGIDVAKIVDRVAPKEQSPAPESAEGGADEEEGEE